MSKVLVNRTIAASTETVFGVVTDIESLPKSNPDVTRVEFLTEQRTGAGTRFRETRENRGRVVVTELELTECVEFERARFLSDMGGTLWDTTFRFRPAAGDSRQTELEIELDAKPHKFLARILNPFVMGMVRRGMRSHIDSLARYCENLATAQGG